MESPSHILRGRMKAHARFLKERLLFASGISLPVIVVILTAPAISQEPPRTQAAERVEVSLVLLDVVVTGKGGHPVSGLTVSDFDLLVDNTRVPIESLEDHCAEPPPPGESAAADGRTGPGDRHFILLFDMSHMKAPSRRDAVRAAARFVDEEMLGTDRVMILAFMRGLHVVTGFSNDPVLLRARLDRLLDDPAFIDTAPFEEEVRLNQIASDVGRSFREAQRRFVGGPAVRNFSFGPVSSDLVAQCESEARQAELEMSRAVRALANAMPSFGALPGRKALIFFTETLRSNPGEPFYAACRISAHAQPSLGLTLLPEVDDLALKANLARVSFYPVHAGGMSPLGTGTAEHSARGLQAGLALSTGGTHSVLMKDPLLAFRRAADDLACHYVLAYRPARELSPGGHSVRVTVRRRGLTARHREFFTLESPREASESRILAALSSPGLYREIEVEGHGHSLWQTQRGKRRFLLKASVPLSGLALLPASASETKGAVRFRGGMISGNELRCEFDRTIPLTLPGAESGAPLRVGLEACCDLDPGDYEIVITARDEVGGSLGTFWGRTAIKGSPLSAGAGILLWAGGSPDIWTRIEPFTWLGPGHESLFLSGSLMMSSDEPAAITFVACAREESRDAAPSATEGSASVRVEGPRALELPAGPAFEGQSGECRIFRSTLPAGALPPGTYTATPRAPPGWRTPGKALRVEVR